MLRHGTQIIEDMKCYIIDIDDINQSMSKNDISSTDFKRRYDISDSFNVSALSAQQGDG